MGCQKPCSVCGAVEGESYIHPFDGTLRKNRVESHHIIPRSWKVLTEYKKLTVPLCMRCHSCCPPSVIASYNHGLSHEVERALNNIFPMLHFEIQPHDCGNPKCPLKGAFYMDITRK
jgi:hypothetical protein